MTMVIQRCDTYVIYLGSPKLYHPYNSIYFNLRVYGVDMVKSRVL